MTFPRVLPMLLLAVVLVPGGCDKNKPEKQKSVVVYTAHDRVLSEPILRAFEEKTGIEVKPVYDVESSKTTGLVMRLIARKDHPDCDVFWNNEIVQTIRLAEEGLLAPYESPRAKRFPKTCRDPEHRWTAFGGRARLIIYNTDQIKPADVPTGLADFTRAEWKDHATFAKPFFGTTLTHMAVLYHLWGPRRLREWCRACKANNVALAPGNGSVRDLVAGGEKAFGLTDTDDAYAAMLDHKPIAVRVPDAQSFGVIVIPNTVSLIADGPNPAAGKELIDFLLSAEVERRLAEGRAAQIPLAKDLTDVSTPWREILKHAKMADVDYTAAAKTISDVVELLRQEKMDQ
jgi:iron(III) transport system substrate-binding protein